MPIVDYVLLAVLGAAGASGKTPTPRILGADALMQPRGGAMAEFTSGGQREIKTSRGHPAYRPAENGPERKHRHRHSRRHRTHPKPEAITIKQK